MSTLQREIDDLRNGLRTKESELRNKCQEIRALEQRIRDLRYARTTPVDQSRSSWTSNNEEHFAARLDVEMRKLERDLAECTTRRAIISAQIDAMNSEIARKQQQQRQQSRY